VDRKTKSPSGLLHHHSFLFSSCASLVSIGAIVSTSPMTRRPRGLPSHGHDSAVYLKRSRDQHRIFANHKRPFRSPSRLTPVARYIKTKILTVAFTTRDQWTNSGPTSLNEEDRTYQPNSRSSSVEEYREKPVLCRLRSDQPDIDQLS